MYIVHARISRVSRLRIAFPPHVQLAVTAIRLIRNYGCVTENAAIIIRAQSRIFACVGFHAEKWKKMLRVEIASALFDQTRAKRDGSNSF